VLFSKMERSGVKPDDIASIGALCACTHAGLVDKGQELFNSFHVEEVWLETKD
jgi:hypothetical protein